MRARSGTHTRADTTNLPVFLRVTGVIVPPHWIVGNILLLGAQAAPANHALLARADRLELDLARV
jgi:hypothetical protein